MMENDNNISVVIIGIQLFLFLKEQDFGRFSSMNYIFVALTSIYSHCLSSCEHDKNDYVQ